MLAEVSWEREKGEWMEAEQGEGRNPGLVWAGKRSQPWWEWLEMGSQPPNECGIPKKPTPPWLQQAVKDEG